MTNPSVDVLKLLKAVFPNHREDVLIDVLEQQEVLNQFASNEVLIAHCAEQILQTSVNVEGSASDSAPLYREEIHTNIKSPGVPAKLPASTCAPEISSASTSVLAKSPVSSCIPVKSPAQTASKIISKDFSDNYSKNVGSNSERSGVTVKCKMLKLTPDPRFIENLDGNTREPSVSSKPLASWKNSESVIDIAEIVDIESPKRQTLLPKVSSTGRSPNRSPDLLDLNASDEKVESDTETDSADILKAGDHSSGIGVCARPSSMPENSFVLSYKNHKGLPDDRYTSPEIHASNTELTEKCIKKSVKVQVPYCTVSSWCTPSVGACKQHATSTVTSNMGTVEASRNLPGSDEVLPKTGKKITNFLSKVKCNVTITKTEATSPPKSVKLQERYKLPGKVSDKSVQGHTSISSADSIPSQCSVSKGNSSAQCSVSKGNSSMVSSMSKGKVFADSTSDLKPVKIRKDERGNFVVVRVSDKIIGNKQIDQQGVRIGSIARKRKKLEEQVTRIASHESSEGETVQSKHHMSKQGVSTGGRDVYAMTTGALSLQTLKRNLMKKEPPQTPPYLPGDGNPGKVSKLPNVVCSSCTLSSQINKCMRCKQANSLISQQTHVPQSSGLLPSWTHASLGVIQTQKVTGNLNDELEEALQQVCVIFPNVDVGWARCNLKKYQALYPDDFFSHMCFEMTEVDYKRRQSSASTSPTKSRGKHRPVHTKTSLEKIKTQQRYVDVLDEIEEVAELSRQARKRHAEESMEVESVPSKMPLLEDETCSMLRVVNDKDEEKQDLDTVCRLQCEACNKLTSTSELTQCLEGHLLCKECVENGAKTILSEGDESVLGCMLESCSSHVTIAYARKVLDKLVVALLQDKRDKQDRKSISKMSDIVSCPECGMSAMLEKLNKQFHCPNQDCMLASCRYCKRPWNDKRHTRCNRLLTVPQQEECLKYPDHWSSVPRDLSQDYMRVDVNLYSEEGKIISEIFFHSMTAFKITRLTRIQNPKLWEKYALTRCHILKDFGAHKLNENHLFHGTDPQNIDSICKEGFDWRLCGQHGTAFGKGSYFAAEGNCSHQYVRSSFGNRVSYQRGPGEGPYALFLARVVCGRYTAGNPGLQRPPVDPNDPKQRPFNSVVNNVHHARIYVTFDSAQSYPEYVIEYDDR